jgi:putative FmdB family regulatory protein
MPKLNGYTCKACGASYEYMHENSADKQVCPACGSNDAELQLGSHTLTVIIPTYRGCKRQKAGYQHTHGDKPAEKISVSVPATFTGEKT